ncbi:NUDIX hydrolase [Patescibacteria group bacterium]|nr:NUDIX hydrolase [Patescibacteria group bacterium]
MSDKKWRLLSSKNLLSTPYLSVQDNDYLLPDGQKARHFYQLIRKDYVLVFVTNDRHEILVEKQYRWGVDDFVYELPAGFLNEGEDPLAAAVREVQEETGYQLKDLTLCGQIYPQPGFCTMRAFVVQASISGLTVKNPEFDETDIPLEFWSLEKVKAAAKQGIIKIWAFFRLLSIFDKAHLYYYNT